MTQIHVQEKTELETLEAEAVEIMKSVAQCDEKISVLTKQRASENKKLRAAQGKIVTLQLKAKAA